MLATARLADFVPTLLYRQTRDRLVDRVAV
jgi:hypothetical protein